MEKWDKHQRKQHHRENPSFSSTLLDVIYRSIDEGTQTKEKEEQLIFYRETMRKQKNREDVFGVVVEAEKPNLRRAKRVENWMEKKAKEKPIMGRISLTELERRTRSNSNTLSMHSSSSSSESSSIGGFSSSESESFYGVHNKPKPIRTSVSYEKTNLEKNQNQNPKHHENKNNNSFGKTKSKALRILYGDMKKAKPPVSPGARLAHFINSLFTASGNAKKAKVSSSPSSSSSMHEASKPSAAAQASSSSSTCSTVSSSFSRSCLSKTPSSRSGAKRSVRFCPVSVIVDEDCRPCGHKNLHEGEETMKVMKNYGNSSKEELRFHVMQESRRVEELARELLKNYQKKNEEDFDLMDCEEEEEDDDDDGASCSSSDLFELDNLSAIGIQRYREELPVYETTHFSTNRAIANGFIM
ncbi:hypothetical protein RIF29_29096 [Crotalaria pallida]|uniref:Protein BIG GRAIN 1-like A n=1 Tax=Crotalaria pallida TaxID=3830 RepID=A0AAN9EEU8_CROPI